MDPIPQFIPPPRALVNGTPNSKGTGQFPTLPPFDSISQFGDFSRLCVDKAWTCCSRETSSWSPGNTASWASQLARYWAGERFHWMLIEICKVSCLSKLQCQQFPKFHYWYVYHMLTIPRVSIRFPDFPNIKFYEKKTFNTTILPLIRECSGSAHQSVRYFVRLLLQFWARGRLS